METTLSPFYKTAIRQELDRRCRQNPRYSIRAFAKIVGLNDGAVSQILSGKRVPSDKTAKKIIAAMSLTPEEAHRFWQSLHDAQLQGGRASLQKSKRNKSDLPLISLDQFQIIADWYHVAILELTRNKKFKPEAKWIAKRLKISEAQASFALQRLIEQGFASLENGRMIKKDKDLTTSDKAITTQAHRSHQKQMLAKAIEALDETPIESRVQVGMTMNIDPRLLPKARVMIQNFSQDLCKFLENGASEQVVQLSMSLFPLETTTLK